MIFTILDNFMLLSRIAAALFMLIYGSYSDLKFREISDKLWIVFAGIGMLLNTLHFLLYGFESLNPILTIVSFTVTAVIAVVLYMIRFYGGADAKAIIVLGIILPLYTSPHMIHPFTPLTILANGFLATLVLPLGYLTFNLLRIIRGEKIFYGLEDESTWKKFVASLLGYRTRQESEGKFLMSLESEIDGRRSFQLGVLREDIEFTSKVDTWVTPGIPLVAYITIGFLLTLYPGDILGLVIRWFFIGLSG